MSFRHRGRVLFPAILIVLTLAHPLSTAGQTGSRWLPSEPLHPRSPSDPFQPRFGLAYAPEPDHLDVALGAPLPLALLSVDHPLMAVLEAGVFLRLGRDGSFFPMTTVDGRIGLALETTLDRVHARARLIHWSAHKADGDTSVSFRDRTFSQEFFDLEIGYRWAAAFLYTRVAAAWHSVPSDRGVDLAVGGWWRGRGRSARPFVSVHVSAASEQEWRLDQSLLAGWEFGTGRPILVSLRGYRGNSPRGQYWKTGERYLGLDLQIAP
jgi:hypothetical protein